MEFYCPTCKENVEGEETLRFCQKCGSELKPRSGTVRIQDPYIKKTLGDKYTITRMIGRGGTARVYQAKQENLNKIVCVKILATEASLQEHMALRFQREADTISRLSHPNIVQVIDFGQVEDTGSPYLVMEYVEGRHLGQYLDQEHPVSEERIVHIMSQVMSALAEAHAKGIIHRDLKPANIIVTRLQSADVFVKVLDFGIAKILDAPDGQELTSTGMFFGTPDYMAPEQASDGVIDHRCDIYAAGIMLYRMVTAQTPFQADTPMATLARRLTERPRPPHKLEGVRVSPELEAVIMKALQRDPADRQADALEMQRELLAIPKGDREIRQRTRPAAGRRLAGRLRAWWRRLSTKDRVAVVSVACLLVVLLLVFGIPSGPGGTTEIGRSLVHSEPPAALSGVQAMIDDGRFVEAEAELDKSSASRSAWGDAMRAQILLFGLDRDVREATGHLHRAIREEPDVLGHPSVRKALVHTLDVRNGEKAVDFAAQHVNPPLIDDLVRAATGRRYWMRWNSVKVLKQIGQLDRVDKVLVYIAELKYAGSCSSRKRAAKKLAKFRDKRAIGPLRQAMDKGFLDNLCMGDALEDAICAIEGRKCP